MAMQVSAARALTLINWSLVCLLLLALYAIARFYERTAHERSHYRWFLLPAGLFAAAGLRYAWIGTYTGDPVGDLLLFAGGVCLFVLGYSLSRLMMGGRR